jgi:hypothetical protein
MVLKAEHELNFFAKYKSKPTNLDSEIWAFLAIL